MLQDDNHFHVSAREGRGTRRNLVGKYWADQWEATKVMLATKPGERNKA